MHYVGLITAVNIGGTRKLTMKDLKALCSDARFHEIGTHIASKNVVYEEGTR